MRERIGAPDDFWADPGFEPLARGGTSASRLKAGRPVAERSAQRGDRFTYDEFVVHE